MFKLTCDNHIPVKPATKKNKIKETTDKKVKSFFKDPFTKVKVQLTTFIVAGIDIIIVTVLYKALLL
jgi:hypothetical protein